LRECEEFVKQFTTLILHFCISQHTLLSSSTATTTATAAALFGLSFTLVLVEDEGEELDGCDERTGALRAVVGVKGLRDELDDAFEISRGAIVPLRGDNEGKIFK